MHNSEIFSEMKLHDLNYHVVPTDRRGYCAHGQIQNDIYDFWTQQWHQAFNRSGNPKKGWEDHFMRQDLVTAISLKGQMIGCLLFTFYDVYSHAARGSEYFSYISDETMALLKKRNLKDVMTVEYLAIDERFSRNSLAVSLGKVIISLAGYVAENQGMDALISMPISGTKVDKMLANIGGQIIQPDIKKYGYTLNLMMALTQPVEKGIDKAVRQVTDDLWARREDYSPTTNPIQIAA